MEEEKQQNPQTVIMKTPQISPEKKEDIKKQTDMMEVVYLPKKMKEGGPRNGSAPGAVAKIERS